ncbi:MAG: 2-C-methyl-D-erythritol 4-phosphate cytidylyltransferase [Thermodesulfobacteriota bacterium]
MTKTPSEKKIPRSIAIIPSAGMGKRMGTKKKVFLPLLERPILAHTVAAFENSPFIDSIIIAVPEDQLEYSNEEIVKRYGFKKVLAVVAGATERQGSVLNALKRVPEGFEITAVHDGARPLVTARVIEDIVTGAARSGAAIPVVKIKDTVKEVSGGRVKRTLDRELLRAVQTPQAFKTDILIKAFERAAGDGYKGTDESSLVERTGVIVTTVEGSNENIKITTPEDLLIAESILRRRGAAKR